MNVRQLAQVGLGLLGVWALLAAVMEFLQIGAVVGGGLAPLAVAVVIPVVLLLGLSYLLIVENARVATVIFPDVGDVTDRAPTDLARTLVALMGVMFLVQGVPAAVSALLSLVAVNSAAPELRDQLIPRLVGFVVPIGVGVYLVTRPSRFIDYVQRPLAERTVNAES